MPRGARGCGSVLSNALGNHRQGSCLSPLSSFLIRFQSNYWLFFFKNNNLLFHQSLKDLAKGTVNHFLLMDCVHVNQLVNSGTPAVRTTTHSVMRVQPKALLVNIQFNFIILSLLTFLPQAEGGTCEGHCGHMGSSLLCFCDDSCLTLNNCCPDYKEKCSPSPGPSPSTLSTPSPKYEKLEVRNARAGQLKSQSPDKKVGIV